MANETYFKVAGRGYLYRAINQFGQVIDVLVAGKQDVTATDRFVIHVLAYGACPAEVSTDRTPVLDELLPVACHM